MLIDWLPTALKFICRASRKPIARKPIRPLIQAVRSSVEGLEQRQLLTVLDVNGVPIPFDTTSTDISNLPTEPDRIPLPTNSGSTFSGVLQEIVSGDGLTNLASEVSRDSQGRVGIRLMTSDPDGLERRLLSLGFVTTSKRGDLNLIEGYVPASSLEQVSTLGVGVTPIYRPILKAGPTADLGASVMGVDRVLATVPPGFDGTGIRVGVLSDSFNIGGNPNLPSLRNGDLPSTVTVLLEGQVGLTQTGQDARSDEGRAMAELIHDVAPGASIAFASGAYGQASFAQQIRNLADPGIGRADILVDDLVYPDEPYFQDGIIAQAIDEVVANHGVAYFSAVGNNGTQSYENTSPSFIVDPNSGFFGTFGPGLYLDFDSSIGVDISNRIQLSQGDSIDLALQWDDPFYTTNGVDTDLDIFAVDSFTGRVVAASTDNNIANGTPFERLKFTVPTNQFFQSLDIIVRLESGPAPTRLKWVDYGTHNSFGFNNTFNYDTQSSTAIGHVNSNSVMGVGAAPYFNALTVEPTSSVGEPIQAGANVPDPNILFSPDGLRLAAPESRQAVDIVAVDGMNTSFFQGAINDNYNYAQQNTSDLEGDNLPNFFGTSAAAAHAAAIGALIKQASPGLSSQQIYDRITSTATDMTTTVQGVVTDVGVDRATGYGLVDAYKAIFGTPIQASLNFADSFESGVLSDVWDTRILGSGRVEVDSANGATEGTQSLVLGPQGSGNLSTFHFTTARSEAILHIDPSSATEDVHLSFDVKMEHLSGVAGTTMSATFIDGENSDGVAFSVDGGNVWYRIISLASTQDDDVFKNYNFNLTQVATDAGIGLTSDVMIKFQTFMPRFRTTVMTLDNVQLYTREAPVVIMNTGMLNYPVGSPPVFIDNLATILAPHTPIFDGGQLTVSIQNNATSSDRIELQDQSKVPNYIPSTTDITLDNNRVLFGGLQVGTYMGGTGSVPLTIMLNSNATLSIVQSLLRDITFRTSSVSNTSRTLLIAVDDGTGAPAGTATRNVNVIQALNVAPTITLNPTSLNLQPGIGATVIDPTATVIDPDSANLSGGLLTFKISNNASATFDRLEIKNQGNGLGQIGFSGTTIRYQGVIIGTLSGGTTDRSILLNAASTPAAVQALVRAITFRTISTSAPLATRTVQFQLSDGDGGTSLIATKLINVVRKNQNPVLSGRSTVATFRLGMAAVPIEPSASVTDADSLNFNGGTLTAAITANGSAFDRLAVRNQGSNVGQIAVSGGTNILYGGILIGTASGGNGTTSPLVVSLNANATPAAVRALMRNITFSTSGANPSFQTRSIRFLLLDGQGGTSNGLTKNVAVSN